MFAVLPSQLTPVAAVDPIAIFIAFIIIVNVISALTKRARQQRSQAQPAASTELQPSGVAEAMRKANVDLAAARAAQRTRLEQAIRAASQQAAQQMSAPVTVAAAPSVPTTSRLAQPMAPAPAPTALQVETLPNFAYASDVAGGLMSLTSIAPEVAAPTTLPILNDRLTLADLFVASAIVGPPASIRPPGHTPAGW
jgi:hypothetical protein